MSIEDTRQPVKKQTKRKKKKIDIKERCCTCIWMMLTMGLGLFIALLFTAQDMGVEIMNPDTYSKAWKSTKRNTNTTHRTNVMFEDRFNRTSYHYAKNDTKCSCYCRSPLKQESMELNAPVTVKEESSSERRKEGVTKQTTTPITEATTFTTLAPHRIARNSEIPCAPITLPGDVGRDSKTVCQDRLPYNLTTEDSNTLASEADEFYLTEGAEDCDEHWLYYFCAYLFPECQTEPSNDWQPACLCPEFNKSVTDECGRLGEEPPFPEKKFFRPCNGTMDSTKCLKP